MSRRHALVEIKMSFYTDNYDDVMKNLAEIKGLGIREVRFTSHFPKYKDKAKERILTLITMAKKDVSTNELYHKMQNALGKCFSYKTMQRIMVELLFEERVTVRKTGGKGGLRNYWSLK